MKRIASRSMGRTRSARVIVRPLGRQSNGSWVVRDGVTPDRQVKPAYDVCSGSAILSVNHVNS